MRIAKVNNVEVNRKSGSGGQESPLFRFIEGKTNKIHKNKAKNRGKIRNFWNKIRKNPVLICVIRGKIERRSNK